MLETRSLRPIEGNLPKNLAESTHRLARELVVETVRLALPRNAEQTVMVALNLMLDIHRDQSPRHDGPYVDHPIRVALLLVANYGIRDPQLIAAALLHDSIEDQAPKLAARYSGSPADDQDTRAAKYIEALLGAKVAKLVKALTNPDFDLLSETMASFGDARTDAQINRQLYFEHFQSIALNNPEAFTIKWCDFSTNGLNLGTVPEGPQKERWREKYGPVAKFLYENLDEIIGSSHPLAPRRELVYQKLELGLRDLYPNRLLVPSWSIPLDRLSR